MDQLFGIVDLSSKYRNIITDLSDMSKALTNPGSQEPRYFFNYPIGIGITQSDCIPETYNYSDSTKYLVAYSGYVIDEYSTTYEKSRANPAKDTFGRYSAAALTERIHHEGSKFIFQLNGIFVVVIYDVQNSELIIINDRYGFYPLYYYSGHDSFIFSSEVKSIVQVKSIKSGINWKGWSDLYNFHWLAGDDTLFNNIIRMPAASELRIDLVNRTVKINKYRTYNEIKPDVDLSDHDLFELISQNLSEAIDKGISISKNVRVPLTGGNDSRTIALTLIKNNHPFTAVSSETETGDLHDIEISRKLASVLKIERKEICLDDNLYKEYFIKNLLRTDFMTPEHLWANPMIESFLPQETIFDGIAGDVIFGLAQRRFKDLESFYNHDLSAVNKLLIPSFRINMIDNCRSIFHEEFYTLLKTEFYDHFGRDLELQPGNPNNSIYLFLNNRTRRGVGAYTFNMLNGVTNFYCPFLENSLFNLIMSIPIERRLHFSLYNRFLNEFNAEAAQIKTHRMMDHDEMKMFSPRNMIYNHPETSGYFIRLFKELPVPKEFINMNQVEKRIKMIKDTNKNAFWFLRPYLYFVLWYNTYFKNFDIRQLIDLK